VEEGTEEAVEDERENWKGVEAVVEGTVEVEVEASRESRGVVARVDVAESMYLG